LQSLVYGFLDEAHCGKENVRSKKDFSKFLELLKDVMTFLLCQPSQEKTPPSKRLFLAML